MNHFCILHHRMIFYQNHPVIFMKYQIDRQIVPGISNVTKMKGDCKVLYMEFPDGSVYTEDVKNK